jgi:predicted nucleic acid-binding protein
MQYLFDSNILIYHLNAKLNQRGSDLIAEGLAGVGAYSVITKIELLGFNQTTAEASQARLLLSRLQEFPLTTTIAEETIRIRKSHRIKLPDAVIAATAIVHQLTMITRNTSDFSAIVGLNSINPFD